MKTRILTQFFLSASLLTFINACSDSTQFAEKTMAAAADASKATDGATTTTNPDGTVASTDPSSDSKAPIDPATGLPVSSSPDASNPSATTSGGTSVSGTKAGGTTSTTSGTTSSSNKPSGSGTTTTGGSTTASNGGTTTSGGTTSTGGSTTASNGGTTTSGGTTSTGGSSTSTSNTGAFAATCSDHPDMPIVSQLYQLPTTTTKLPDFSTMNPIGDVCVNQLTIADREFTQGFPGVSDIFEYFALDMRFKLNISTPGTYTFYTDSDDGSILFIDGKQVVNNDGNHQVQEKSGTIYLGSGVHDVEVQYYQGPRVRIAMELFWTTPGSSAKVYVPKSVMMRP